MTHNAEIDLREIVREAYLLGYQDRAAERDYDPGRALDLLRDYGAPSVIPPEVGE